MCGNRRQLRFRALCLVFACLPSSTGLGTPPYNTCARPPAPSISLLSACEITPDRNFGELLEPNRHAQRAEQRACASPKVTNISLAHPRSHPLLRAA